ncbi:hypothetical protein D3C81_819060 [compost metagenome]
MLGLDAGQGFRGVDHVQHRAGNGAAQRVAAIGGAVGADGQVLGQFGGGQHGTDRETAAQALGAGQDVRGNAVVLVGIQRTGTANAGLHFVEDQQGVVFVTQFARAFQVGLVGRHHAALALDRLDHHGAGLVGNLCLQRFQVVVGHVADAGDLRTETVGVLRLATDADGEQGTAVEAVHGGDDFVLFRAEAVMGDATGQLESGLVGLGAGVAEERTVGKGGVHQLVGQAQGRLVGEHVGYVPEGVGLLGQGLDQCRVAVAQGVDRDATGKVDQLATRLVPDAGTLASHRNEGRRRIVGDHDLVEIGTLHRGLLNGHLSLLKRNAGLEVASDGGIVRTDPRLSLRPSDNLLQRKTQF